MGQSIDQRLVAQLEEVARSGAPAQRAHAGDLLARLHTHPDDPSTLEEAELLIDAFQHDPYLWKASAQPDGRFPPPA